MKKEEAVVILGTPHRMREPGKQSPDGRLKECVYGREIAGEIKVKLEGYGLRTFIDYEPLDLPEVMWSKVVKTERYRELALRVRAVNELCQRYGKENCLYVSMHVDAIGNDGKWHDAHGWSVRVSPLAGSGSRLLAECLFDCAAVHGLTMRQPMPRQKYWEQSLKVLNDTLCPAVLTENLFQDNRKDVAFLLSDEGRHAIERLHVEGIMNYIEKR